MAKTKSSGAQIHDAKTGIWYDKQSLKGKQIVQKQNENKMKALEAISTIASKQAKGQVEVERATAQADLLDKTMQGNTAVAAQRASVAAGAGGGGVGGTNRRTFRGPKGNSAFASIGALQNSNQKASASAVNNVYDTKNKLVDTQYGSAKNLVGTLLLSKMQKTTMP